MSDFRQNLLGIIKCLEFYLIGKNIVWYDVLIICRIKILYIDNDVLYVTIINAKGVSSIEDIVRDPLNMKV